MFKLDVIQARKWVGPRMLKGQLSRVPWPGNSWMPFTFQPALVVLQLPHKHSNSLQLVIHTELAYHYIQYALSTLSAFFLFVCFFFLGFLQSTARPHQRTTRPLERAGSHIKVTPSLFIPVAAMGKCKQINNSNLPYMVTSFY